MVPMLPILGLLLFLLVLPAAISGDLDRLVYCELQIEWFLSLNTMFSKLPHQFWANVTLMGNAAVLLLISSPLLLYRARAWYAMIAAAPLAAVFSLVGKNMALVPRPGAVLQSYEFTSIGGFLTAHNSLPSGHSITVFAGAIAAATMLTNEMTGFRRSLICSLFVTVAALVALSRIAVGAHWPLDVWAGSALGWIAGMSGAYLVQRYHSSVSELAALRASLGIAIVLLIAAAGIIDQAVDQPVALSLQYYAGAIGILIGVLLLRKTMGERRRLRAIGVAGVPSETRR